MGVKLIFIQFVIFPAIINGLSDLGNHTDTNNDNGTDVNVTHEDLRYHVAIVDFHHVMDPFIIVAWVIFASLAKAGFHMYNKLSSIFPESCLLIVLGVFIGLILYFTNILPHKSYYMTSPTFFLYLLPPIVLEAGYSMPNRAFFDNIGTILVFAVVGTLLNTLLIGSSLWLVGDQVLKWTGIPMSLLTCLVFSSLISAVDPVAVLAVFEEVHVNEILFIIVFGESLLNDAVTVVLYHMFEKFTEIQKHGSLIPLDFMAGFLSFIVVSGGGTFIGVFYGGLTGFITKYTNHVSVIEPVFIIMMAYMSYLTAELFHLSGILAIVFCGIFMKPYVKANITEKSSTTVSYFMKMLSSVSETIIFMFLGLSTVTDIHDFRLVYVLLTLLFCFVYRVIGVVLLSFVANRFRVLKLSAVDQFVMAYGGLRGAIAFALVVSLPESIIPEKRVLVTTTIVVIFFTVFIQGITIKPLVNILRVKKENKHEITMNERINTRLMDHLSTGVEDIVGHFGHHRLRDRFQVLNSKYLEPWLLREKRIAPGDMGIFRTYSKLSMKDAVEYISRRGSFLPQTMEPNSLSQAIRRASSVQDSMAMKGLDSNGLHHNDTVLDMHSLDVNYSRKMADASKCHHIVEENMFRPRKKWRTSRNRYNVDEVVNHPPFHHNVRRNLRHMVSRRTAAAAASAAAAEKRKKEGAVKTVRNISFQVLDDSPITVETHNMESPAVSDSDSDAGITFTVGEDDDSDGEGEEAIEHPEHTAAESSLPWKRAYIQPALPSFTHISDTPLETAQVAECPSWAANLDYVIDSPHNISLVDEPEPTNDTGLFSIPPPWRTSPSSDDYRTENDSAFPESHVDFVDNDVSHETQSKPFEEYDVSNEIVIKPVVDIVKSDKESSQTADKPISLDLHDNAKDGGKTLGPAPLPWRSPSASNEVESMISPSASQIWAHGPMGAIVKHGESHHSNPISGHHHVTTAIYDELQDYHSLLPNTTNTFHNAHFAPDISELDDEEALVKLQFHRRHPSFIRTKCPLPRRPSISLPVELNREEDCRDRIHKWLQSSHPDGLACPPDFVLDMQPTSALDETVI